MSIFPKVVTVIVFRRLVGNFFLDLVAKIKIFFIIYALKSSNFIKNMILRKRCDAIEDEINSVCNNFRLVGLGSKSGTEISVHIKV